MDYKAITSFIKTSKENQGFEIFCIENEKYCKKLLVDKYDYEKSRDTYTPCIFAYDRIMSESDYIVNDFKIFSDVEIFNSSGQVKKGLKKYRAHMLKYVGVKKIPKLITVVLAIKRPMQVLGTFDKFDYIAFLLDFDFESNPDELGKCNISNLSTMGMVTKELAEKISGTEFDKTGITIIGVGAVGSKISMHLSRMGYINQTIYDNDCLLPHNLVRHEEKYPGMVGMPKALIAKLNIDLLFRNESKCIDGYKDILKHDIELDDEIIVDATASERCLNLLCSKKNIKGIVVRTEVFADGNVGATFVEGNKKNPDIYDLRVSLWNKARDSQEICDWLIKDKIEINNEIYIGIGCSSDTFVLDNATISNHASIVPHIINRYVGGCKGIIALNYFNKNNLVDNHIEIYEIESFEIFEINDWSVHISKDVWNNVKKYLEDPVENMGIWLGAINTYLKRIVIVDTYIPSDNERKVGEVTSGIKGVRELLKNCDYSTNGLIGYVGEWHTHNGNIVKPSNKDLIAFSQVEPGRITLMTILGKKKVNNIILDKRGDDK